MTEDELTHNASPLIAKYRQLKAKADDLKEQMDGIREGIGGIVAEEGNYKDDVGCAEFRESKERVSYPSAAVEKCAQAWASSDDPILAQCGQLLLAERRTTPAKRTLYIK